jgi:ABC-type transporter Mla MlaB component
MLRITVHDDQQVMTFQLEGRLAGPWVGVLEECRERALSRRAGSAFSVDLTGVTFVDPAGKVCLTNMHRQGAEFVAADCLMTAIVAEITQPPLEDHGRQKDDGESRPESNRGAT